jgi:hypothetical protein
VETEKIVYTNKTDKEIDSINNANSLNPPVQITDNATLGSASSSGSAVSSDPLANYKVETNVNYTPCLLQPTHTEVAPANVTAIHRTGSSKSSTKIRNQSRKCSNC